MIKEKRSYQLSLTMYDYVAETPSACKRILQDRKIITEKFVKKSKDIGAERILLIASGSSRNAAVSARLFIEKYLKIPVKIVTPLFFTNYERFYGKNDLIMAVSESGRSLTTIAAVKKVMSEGLDCMVLTNNPESPITHENKDVIDLSCGTETVGYVTKGYTATVLDLMLFGIESALELGRVTQDEYQGVIAEMTDAIGLIGKIIEQTGVWYRDNKESFLSAKRVMVLGYGANCGTAMEGALKMEETIGLPSNAFELEDFMHGPNLELTENSTVFFINTKSDLESRMLSLKDYVSRITGKSFLISHGDISSDHGTLSIKHCVKEEISPLFLTVPFQIAAYLMCRDRGINLDESRPADQIFKLSKINP